MRRLALLATLGVCFACAAPAKRPFTAADLGPAERHAFSIRPSARKDDPGRGGPEPGGSAELRVLADGRLLQPGESDSLPRALIRFDATRFDAEPAGRRRAWRQLLVALDLALAGPRPPRLELLRVATAFETALAETADTDPELAAQLRAPVAARLAILEERLATPPERRGDLPRIRFGSPLEPVVVTSFFGPRADPFDGRPRWHLGIDLEAESGQAILAAAAGEVVSAGWAGGHGQRIELAHDDGTVTGYSHLSLCLVAPGDRAEVGQPIGLAGATGRSTGPHLHFEVWRDGEPEDPLEFLGDEAVEVRTDNILE